jgi:oligopeptide/dipeptide ABC transporter ATP-binding protein
MSDAARQAARGLNRDFGELAELQVSRKGAADFVSAADIKAEQSIFESLSKARPGYSFLGEERGLIEGTDKTHTWIVDPLDGTTNFLHAIPHFAINIALQREGVVVAAVTYNPVANELVWAEKGKGAFVNDRRLRVAARQRLDEYPHQLSGGMRQRVMIAMAMVCEPRVLIADEPTTALDVTIQAQILALMSRLQKDTGMSMLFITHNLGVVAHHAERVAVMYAGQVVEQAGVHELFAKPAHPYTQGLLACLPGRARQLARQSGQAVALQDIPGQAPAMNRLGSGCSFADRCSVSLPACQHQAPPWVGGPSSARLCHLESKP